MGTKDTFTEEEQARRDKLLLKLLKTPPQPRDKKGGPQKAKSGRKRARKNGDQK